MNQSTFIGLANNAALLIALGLVFDTIVLKQGFEKLHIKILTGVAFGLLGMIVMLTPWEFIPGIFFDTRSVILSVGGLYFGIIPTIIAVLMTGILRFIQGGIGTWTGIGVIVTSALLGLLWRHQRLTNLDRISLIELYLFGLLVHIAMLLWMLALPWPIAKRVLSGISLPVMLMYPIGTLLLGALLEVRLKRKKEGVLLQESESRWRSLTKTTSDQILTLDPQLNIQFANFAFPGTTVENMIGKPLVHYIEDKKNQTEVKEILENVLLTGNHQSIETFSCLPEGETIYYESRVSPRTLEGSPKLIGLTVSSRNITERKLAEEKLKESEIRFKTIIKDTKAGYFLIDKDGIICDVNQSWAEMYKYSSPQEIIGQHFVVIQKAEDIEGAKQFFDGIMKGNPQYLTGEFSRKCKDGSIAYHTFTANPVIRGEKAIGIEGFIIDTTDRKQYEENMEQSLKEKETLLQEIHHRVKNNMQVISSLLKLQSNSIEDQQSKRYLLESQSRIYAMSLIHESLHSSENLSAILLKPYLLKIANSLVQSYSVHSGKLTLNVESADVKLDIDHANPLGLIINELISNALKYAFPDDRTGIITLTVKQQHPNELEVIISDNGIGFPDHLDWKNAKTLGLQLVKTLVENQLHGSVELENKAGSKFIITFSIDGR